jgi:hypothetical protein
MGGCTIFPGFLLGILDCSTTKCEIYIPLILDKVLATSSMFTFLVERFAKYDICYRNKNFRIVQIEQK